LAILDSFIFRLGSQDNMVDVDTVFVALVSAAAPTSRNCWCLGSKFKANETDEGSRELDTDGCAKSKAPEMLNSTSEKISGFSKDYLRRHRAYKSYESGGHDDSRKRELHKPFDQSLINAFLSATNEISKRLDEFKSHVHRI
jgi:hypothetical protein